MPKGTCAYCEKTKVVAAAACTICGKEHEFCGICRKGPKKPAALQCMLDNGRISKKRAKEIRASAEKTEKQAKKVKKDIQKCKKRARKAPVVPVIDRTQFGPADEADIATNPLRYVQIRANEIWSTNPTLFNQTTACVTIVECGATRTRSVILTSCVEGPNVHPALQHASKAGERLPTPDPIVYRVRKRLPEDAPKGAKKPKDPVFLARATSLNPVQVGNVAQDPDYASAQRSMAARNPPYTVVSRYPGADANETHAERRANAWAAANGCTVIAQAPTIGCCDKCQTSLGDEGLAKVPAERRTPAAYNQYRAQTLAPTHDAMKQGA